MSEQNKNLVRRALEEVWNRGNYAVVDELVAKDYLGHSGAEGPETHGREGYRKFFATQREAFPDIEYEIEDQIAEGDKVVTRWTARATHTGEFQGIPPTGRPGTVTGMTIFRIADGSVVECWTNMDELGMMQQLGVIPAPTPARR
jgi:steroid delta-isomerase-like uncharacterized protein